jgi:3-deoxy-D-manno-octulosonic acid kinase
MKRIFHNGYWFGANDSLSPSCLDQLTACFQSPDVETREQLGGRVSVSRIKLDGIGPVVVKTFRRGGLLARLVERTYLRTGKVRSRIEFEQMEKALKMGVRTPKPVAFAYKGSLFYQAWLITREIPSAQSLAQLSNTAPNQATAALQELDRQVSILIDHKILHADFHPGNVLVDESGRVYLIDFDKASTYAGSRHALASKYRQRWYRAVQKHGLPKILVENIRTWLT